MSIIQGTFTATAQQSLERTLTVGTRLIVSLYGTWTGAIRLCAVTGCAPEQTYATFTQNGTFQYELPLGTRVRLHAAMVSTGTVGYRFEEANACSYLGDNEWDDLRFQASGINPAGSVAPPTVETDVNLYPGSLLFSKSATNTVVGMAQMPHDWKVGSVIRPHIHWMLFAAGSGAVTWEFKYRVINRGVASEAWSSAIPGVLELTHGGLANVEAVSSFGEIVMTNPVPSKMIAWQLSRIGGDGGDTYDDLARLLELDFHYQKDSLGTGAEFIK